MNESSSLLLLAVGGGAASMLRGVRAAYGDGARMLAVDTDATSGAPEIPFALIGGGRLAGRGSGGRAAEARQAFLDDPGALDKYLDGIRTAVVVTALGGGTADGATPEILRRLHELGIVTLVYATLPYSFESDIRLRGAEAARGAVERLADAAVILPLDRLAAGTEETLRDARAHAFGTLAAGVTLLWRLLEKPGYIRFTPERLRTLLTEAGPAHFATASAVGDDRVARVLTKLAEMRPSDGETERPVRRVLVGVLAGTDLRLSEIGEIASGVRAAFGDGAELELGTVEDDTAFAGRLAVVVLAFEESAAAREPAAVTPALLALGARSTQNRAAAGTGRFNGTTPTIVNGEDLDVPTYIRRGLTLES